MTALDTLHLVSYNWRALKFALVDLWWLCHPVQNILSHISCLDTFSKHFCSVLLCDWCGASTLFICVYLPHNDTLLLCMTILDCFVVSWRVSLITTISITFLLQVTFFLSKSAIVASPQFYG